MAIAIYTIYKLINNYKFKQKLQCEQPIHDAHNLIRLANIDMKYEQDKQQRQNNHNNTTTTNNTIIGIPSMPEHFINTIVLTPSDIDQSIHNSTADYNHDDDRVVQIFSSSTTVQ